MNSNGMGTVMAVGFGLLVLYLVVKNIPTIPAITIPTPGALPQ